jgi:hypothetical protein
LQAVLSDKLKSAGRGWIKQIDSLADRVSPIPDYRAKAFAALVKTVFQDSLPKNMK